MEKQTAGWILIAFAAFQLIGLVSIELAQVKTPEELQSFGFIAKLLGHISSVGMAAIGGKLLPNK